MSFFSKSVQMVKPYFSLLDEDPSYFDLPRDQTPNHLIAKL